MKQVATWYMGVTFGQSELVLDWGRKLLTNRGILGHNIGTDF